jgi:hypothetical protein
VLGETVDREFTAVCSKEHNWNVKVMYEETKVFDAAIF